MVTLTQIRNDIRELIEIPDDFVMKFHGNGETATVGIGLYNLATAGFGLYDTSDPNRSIRVDNVAVFIYSLINTLVDFKTPMHFTSTAHYINLMTQSGFILAQAKRQIDGDIILHGSCPSPFGILLLIMADSKAAELYSLLLDKYYILPSIDVYESFLRLVDYVQIRINKKSMLYDDDRIDKDEIIYPESAEIISVTCPELALKDESQDVSFVEAYKMLHEAEPEITENMEENRMQEMNKDKKKEIYEKMKNGDYAVKYDFKTERNPMPLALLAKYIPVDDFFNAAAYIKDSLDAVLERIYGEGLTGEEAIGDDYINFNLTGLPGTGKTVLAQALSAAFQMPIGIVRNAADTDSDEFEGKTRIVDGKPEFVTTDFVEIFTNGGIIVNEECNLTPAGIMMGAIGQAIESPFILKVNGYKTVKRHPLCILINTFNQGEAGTKMTSAPFMSRSPVTYELKMPSANETARILQMKTGADESLCNCIYNVYERIIRYLKSDDVGADDAVSRITLRHCIAAAKLCKSQPVKTAVKQTLGNALCQVSYELAENVNKYCIDTMTV